jgi:hypothetical protein
MNNNSNVNGTLILVLGILSLICLPILGPVAWILGNGAMNTLNTGGGDDSQRGLVNAGRICGIIGTVFFVLGIVYYAVAAPQIMRQIQQAQPR